VLSYCASVTSTSVFGVFENNFRLLLTQWQEIACFSYDEKHQFRLDDSSIRYYWPPTLGADLSRGFDTFEKLDDTADDHLDSLLKTIIAHEQELEKPVEADLITWRGMMTKVSFEFQLETSSFSVEYTKS
jgi:RAT1-interacting protein